MHPLAIQHLSGRKSGGNSGAWNEVQAGDHVIYLIDGRTGTLDECIHDGEALITWDDGTFGIVNWYNLAPSSKVKVTGNGWEAVTETDLV